MFDLELRRKRWQLEVAEARYDRAQATAESQGLTGYDLQQHLSGWWTQITQASEEYQLARSRKIIQQARRLEIPVPEINDSDGTWERGTTFEGRFLTDLGVSRLKAAIRAERRERYESWSRWVVLAIGLVGAITGLVAVLSTFF